MGIPNILITLFHQQTELSWDIVMYFLFIVKCMTKDLFFIKDASL